MTNTTASTYTTPDGVEVLHYVPPQGETTSVEPEFDDAVAIFAAGEAARNTAKNNELAEAAARATKRWRAKQFSGGNARELSAAPPVQRAIDIPRRLLTFLPPARRTVSCIDAQSTRIVMPMNDADAYWRRIYLLDDGTLCKIVSADVYSATARGHRDYISYIVPVTGDDLTSSEREACIKALNKLCDDE